MIVGNAGGIVASIVLTIAAAIFFGPPIIGYFMTQSYVDDGKIVHPSNAQLGWFLLIGYPIILILLCIAIIWWWYNKKTDTNPNTEPLLS